MRIKLNVEYKDKDLAKEKGAFWDSELKTWYLPNSKNISEFERWLPESCIIAKKPIFIAKNSRICWRCNKETPLIALSSEEHIRKEYVEDESEEMDWFVYDSLVLYFFITYLPSELIEIIQKEFPFFKLIYSKQIKGKYWANTCVHCKALQGDFFNHCEPDGAFSPTSEDEAKEIELLKIDVKYDLPIVGGINYDDFLHFIETYSIRN